MSSTTNDPDSHGFVAAVRRRVGKDVETRMPVALLLSRPAYRWSHVVFGFFHWMRATNTALSEPYFVHWVKSA